MKKRYMTERLQLVVLDETFAEKILDFYMRNAVHLEPWEPLRQPGFDQAASHKQALAFEHQAFINRMMVRFWFFKKRIQRSFGQSAVQRLQIL